jgi:hypothetical protein
MKQRVSCCICSLSGRRYRHCEKREFFLLQGQNFASQIEVIISLSVIRCQQVIIAAKFRKPINPTARVALNKLLEDPECDLSG